MEPLAAQLRPEHIDDIVGQKHLIGVGKPLRVAIEKKHLFSFILWGPPGVGKTTLARIYAKSIDITYYELSAVSAGKADIKEIIDAGGDNPVILFLDEIHRFNKAQQDFLLPFVESGKLTLIGATTENPSFEVIPALLSRCRVFTLMEHNDEDMHAIIDRATKLSRSDLDIGAEARDWLVSLARGDARQAISVIDATMQLYGSVTIDTLKQAIQSSLLRYDKAGEEHFNTVSAFIKSMRASNVDAAIYYLARMTEAGEDPIFIARRMVIFASEDIGIMQPTALVVANAVFRACETIGYPECAINLAQGVAYLAGCKKDRSTYDAFRAAQSDVRSHGNLPIPLILRNASTKLMSEMGYGEGYEKYTDKDLLPEKLKGKKYFTS